MLFSENMFFWMISNAALILRIKVTFCVIAVSKLYNIVKTFVF